MDRSVPKQAVKRWAGDEASLELISDGINLVYRCNNSDGNQYLRITHVKLRPESELSAAIDFQNHLVSSKVSVCQPVVSLNGNYIEKIKQEGHVFLAHICKEVPGIHMHFDYEDNQLYYLWGQEVAKMHRASQIFVPENKTPISHWYDSFIEMRDYIKSEPKNIQEELENVHKAFNGFEMNHDNYGVTHGDHRKGNVLSNGQQVFLIDFDLPRYHWFMEDIARPFFSCIIKGKQNWQDKLPHYIEGYQSIMPLSQDDLSSFSYFTRLKSLEIYLWTKNNWTDDKAPGGMLTKDWLALLKAAIESPGKITGMVNEELF